MGERKEMESEAIRVRAAERGIEERDGAAVVEWARGGLDGKPRMNEREGFNL